jgi:hypothetical protein
LGTINDCLAHYQSFQGRSTVVRCRDIRTRSKHEVDPFSAICAAILADRSDVALQIAIHAGGGRDWDTATALDLIRPGALGNDDLRRRLRKDAAQIKSNRGTGEIPSRTTAGVGGKWQKKKGNKGGSGARQGVSSSSNAATKH